MNPSKLARSKGSRLIKLLFLLICSIFLFTSQAFATINLQYGVNLSGAEFDSGAIYPNAADFDYYHSKNLNLIRVPFKWERIQSALNGTLDLANLDAVVALAAARGMKIILDVHNCGKYNGTAINTGAVTYAAYKDLWTKLAAHYNGNTTIVGYGLMNEPGLSSSVWTTAAQNAIDGIRTVDAGHAIYVAYWMGPSQSANTDPQNNLVYEAHIYFDSDNTGWYTKTYDADGAYPMVGVDRADYFLNWCIGHKAKGFIGEYGIPNNDARWNTVLDNFLQYLKANGISGTYWAGGHAWGTGYSLCSDPVAGVDSPQMSVLQNYTTATYSGNYTGDVFNYTGSVTTGNLAIGKKAFSSGDFSLSACRWKAIDGIGSGGAPWGAGTGVPTFLCVDLGQACSVNKFVVTHDGNHPSVDFKIQYSSDGLNFTDCVIVTGNGSAVTTHNITAVSARYFRMYITNPGNDGISRIGEFEIDGTGGSGSGTGLSATYFNAKDFTGNTKTRVDPTINFDWAYGSPDPSIGVDNYSCRWEGQVQAQYSQLYTFYVRADDGVRLWVNGTLLIDQWKDEAATEYSGTISLTAGQKVSIKMEYYENAYTAVCQLSWSSPSTAKTIIPQTQLYPAADGLPSPWDTTDIGNPLAGSASYSVGIFTVNGSGADIWYGSDQFRFVYQSLNGDGEIIARVNSLQNTDPYAKAGVMIRETLAANSKYFDEILTTGNGSAEQWRNTTGGNCGYAQSVGISVPYWVRIVRSGNIFTAYRSANGTTWVQEGSAQTIPMNTSVYIGLCVTSHNTGLITTAVFDNVQFKLGISGYAKYTGMVTTAVPADSNIILTAEPMVAYRGSVINLASSDDSVKDVQILSASGALIKMVPMSSGSGCWNLKNDSGQSVAPGIYMVMGKGKQGSSTLKIGVR